MEMIDPSIVILSIINFCILYFIVRKFFFNKIKKSIDDRDDYINERLEMADEELEKGRLLAIENQRLLSNAKEEGKKITQSYKEKAEKLHYEITEDAKKEAEEIISRAKLEIEREREKVSFALRKEAVELALELSKKVIESNIDEEKNRKLINEFITEVGK